MKLFSAECRKNNVIMLFYKNTWINICIIVAAFYNCNFFYLPVNLSCLTNITILRLQIILMEKLMKGWKSIFLPVYWIFQVMRQFRNPRNQEVDVEMCEE